MKRSPRYLPLSLSSTSFSPFLFPPPSIHPFNLPLATPPRDALLTRCKRYLLLGNATAHEVGRLVLEYSWVRTLRGSRDWHEYLTGRASQAGRSPATLDRAVFTISIDRETGYLRDLARKSGKPPIPTLSSLYFRLIHLPIAFP